MGKIYRWKEELQDFQRAQNQLYTSIRSLVFIQSDGLEGSIFSIEWCDVSVHISVKMAFFIEIGLKIVCTHFLAGTINISAPLHTPGTNC